MQRSSDELLLHAIDCAKQIDAVVNGDTVVIAAGIPLNTTGSTNLMRVAIVARTDAPASAKKGFAKRCEALLFCTFARKLL